MNIIEGMCFVKQFINKNMQFLSVDNAGAINISLSIYLIKFITNLRETHVRY
jgi:hypothetical protein